MKNNLDEIETEVVSAVGTCRNQVLKMTELAIGNHERWLILRGQLLNVFGMRGLEGQVNDIFFRERDFGTGAQNEIRPNK